MDRQPQSFSRRIGDSPVLFAIAAALLTAPPASAATLRWTGDVTNEFFRVPGNWDVVAGFDGDNLPDADDTIEFVSESVPSPGVRAFNGTTVNNFSVRDGSFVNFRPEGLFTVTGGVDIGGGQGGATTTFLVVRAFSPSSRLVANRIDFSRGGGILAQVIGLVVDGSVVEAQATNVNRDVSDPVRVVVQNGGRLSVDRLDLAKGGNVARSSFDIDLDFLATGATSSFQAGELFFAGRDGPSQFTVAGGADIAVGTASIGASEFGSLRVQTRVAVRDFGSTWTGGSATLGRFTQADVTSGGAIDLTGTLQVEGNIFQRNVLNVSGTSSRVEAQRHRFILSDVTVANAATLTATRDTILRDGSVLTIGANGVVNAGTLVSAPGTGTNTLRINSPSARLNIDGYTLPTSSVFALDWSAGIISFTGDATWNREELVPFTTVPAGGELLVSGLFTLRRAMTVDGRISTAALDNQSTLAINGSARFNGTSVFRSGSTTTVNSLAVFNGDASGAGSFPGGGDVSFAFSSVYRPGDDDAGATVDFGGDLDISVLARTEFDLFGPDDYDRLSVAQRLTNLGTVDVLLREGYVPGLGDKFDLFDAVEINFGPFSQLNLPDLPPTLAWDDSAYAATGMVRVVAGAIPEPAGLLLATVGFAMGSGVRRRPFPER